MKAISIKQPWADLIVNGIKDIENRTWRTNYRGKLLIHAPAKLATVGFNSVGGCVDLLSIDQLIQGISDDEYYKLVRGRYITSAIIGEVYIVDCVMGHESIWAEPNVWNWVLENPVAYHEPTLQVKGALSIWNY